MQQMHRLQELLQHWNTQINLTRLIEKEDYWVGQIFDSLWPFKPELHQTNKNLNFIDIGSGCGFPGFAIAIALPKVKVTLVDSASKKTNVLAKIVKELGLDNRVFICNERAEVIGHDKSFRGVFDIAMARAVAPPPIVAEYLVPLINKDGEALLFTGQWNGSDAAKLEKALNKLKAKVITTQSNMLPCNRGIRHQIRLKAREKCPEIYPRKVGVPKKNPLGS